MEKQESQIEKYFTRQFKKYFKSEKEGLLLKQFSASYTGMPDRDVIVKNLPIIKVELKRPSGGLSPRQRYVHRILKGLGVEVHTFNSKEEVDEFLKDLHNDYLIKMRTRKY